MIKTFKFLNDKSSAEKYSTSLALIHITEIIKEARKAFDTVDHNILLGKLKHYDINL